MLYISSRIDKTRRMHLDEPESSENQQPISAAVSTSTHRASMWDHTSLCRWRMGPHHGFSSVRLPMVFLIQPAGQWQHYCYFESYFLRVVLQGHSLRAAFTIHHLLFRAEQLLKFARHFRQNTELELYNVSITPRCFGGTTATVYTVPTTANIDGV
jgi:hypothetical protein